ncbi:LysR family transcriptional regulator [Streptomyces alanosinicus]|uniref:LysR family transcriptional regulator n=1 Tax=Streptomyces alanosinicus TaxID=68171 RepID=A0A919D669_9ACTN|nr:LysR family transcriptional regulator [Streptomyces alanosinicus]GHE13709.1 LysR family transcriptional regulator [Streptomyces alanosinicus]
MELRDIEIFLTLADELHFGRTAERLHVTAARVSQAIKKQERTIGAALFERTSRQVTLTPVGRQLRDDLLPAYGQIQQAIARAAAFGCGISGVLRVGFSAAWCGNLIVKAADNFRNVHPDCEVQIIEMPLHDRFGSLRSGEFDLQLTELPADEPDIVNGPVVFSDQRALALPAAHPLAQRPAISLEDLASVPLITISGPPAYWLDFHLPRHTPTGKAIRRGPATVAWQEALSLVGAGKGACPTSIRSAQYYARPELAYIPFHDAPPIEFGLFWLATGNTVAVQAFVQTVLETADGPGRFAGSVGHRR